jgi:hypothetical protein
MTDAEADAIVQSAFRAQDRGSVGAIFQTAFTLPPSVLREMCNTPRGHQAAESLAFQNVTFAEYVRLPVLVAATEYVHQNGMGRQSTPDDETIIWDVAQQAYTAHQAGRLGASQLLQLALAWKGTTNTFGWGGVAGTLPPELRVPIAYLLGHRYQLLGKPAEAVKFLELAKQEAPPDSLLHRRATASIASLKEQ